jgi:hypothetical protein
LRRERSSTVIRHNVAIQCNPGIRDIVNRKHSHSPAEVCKLQGLALRGIAIWYCITEWQPLISGCWHGIAIIISSYDGILQCFTQIGQLNQGVVRMQLVAPTRHPACCLAMLRSCLQICIRMGIPRHASACVWPSVVMPAVCRAPNDTFDQVRRSFLGLCASGSHTGALVCTCMLPT